MRTKAQGKKLLVLITSLLLIVGVLIYVYVPKNHVYNMIIDENVLSAKDLFNVAQSYFNTDWRLKRFHVQLSEISMHLDNNHRGEVSLMFTELSSKKPQVFKVQFDTNESKLINIQNYGREEKLYSDPIHLDKWAIDSTNAVQLSVEYFENFEGFSYDIVSVTGCADAELEEEYWFVMLHKQGTKTNYYTWIDAYSGNIIASSVN